MYNYIKGKITEVTPNYIVIDNSGIGYQIYTGNPYSFQEGEEYTIYVYQKIAEDDNSLYGFKTKDQKELFLRLIDVKGVGPKMALPMIALGSVSGIVDAIDRENILYLTTIELAIIKKIIIIFKFLIKLSLVEILLFSCFV